MELINKCKRWQAIPMELIYDSELSLMAKAIYMLLAGLPAASKITATQLELLHGVSRKTAGKYMLELRDRGWLECVSERKDLHKVYVLHGTLAREEFTHVAQRARVKSTRARGNSLPALEEATHYYNKSSILNNNIEDSNSPEFYSDLRYHYPFREGLNYKQKLACLVDGVNGFVKNGILSPEQAKDFVLYWGEPMCNDGNMLRMEGQSAWKLSSRIERWIVNTRRNG